MGTCLPSLPWRHGTAPLETPRRPSKSSSRLAALLALGLLGPHPSSAAAAPQPNAGSSAREAADAQGDSEGLSAKLGRVEREAQSISPPTAVSRPLAEARHALGRSRGARAAGDEPHAVLLERLAADWLEIASATVRAIRAEQAAKAESQRAQDLQLKLDRGRALQAEQQARKGRLLAEVQRLEQQAAKQNPATEPSQAGGAPGQTTPSLGQGPRLSGKKGEPGPGPKPKRATTGGASPGKGP
jgi:hypothetical protein